MEVISWILFAAFGRRGYIKRTEIHEIFARYLRELDRLCVAHDGFHRDLDTETFPALDDCIFSAKAHNCMDEHVGGILGVWRYSFDRHIEVMQSELAEHEQVKTKEAARVTYAAYRDGRLDADLDRLQQPASTS